jgi:hypothetical protein
MALVASSERFVLAAGHHRFRQAAARLRQLLGPWRTRGDSLPNTALLFVRGQGRYADPGRNIRFAAERLALRGARG